MAVRGKPVTARRTYTDEDKAAVCVALRVAGMDPQFMGGNVKRVSRETGIPQQTIRDWRKEWAEDGGPTSAQLEKAEEIMGELVHEMDTARREILTQVRKIVPTSTNLGQLMTAFGILTDKIAMANGAPTSRQETQVVLPSHAEWKELLAPYAQTTLAEAQKRTEEIIDAEVIEQAPKALNPG